MSTDVIVINTSKDIPYGPLHNDFKFNLMFNLKGEKWNSISNYVYSKMVKNDTNRILLENFDTNAPPKKTDKEQKIIDRIKNTKEKLARQTHKNYINLYQGRLKNTKRDANMQLTQFRLNLDMFEKSHKLNNKMRRFRNTYKQKINEIIS